MTANWQKGQINRVKPMQLFIGGVVKWKNNCVCILVFIWQWQFVFRQPNSVENTPFRISMFREKIIAKSSSQQHFSWIISWDIFIYNIFQGSEQNWWPSLMQRLDFKNKHVVIRCVEMFFKVRVQDTDFVFEVQVITTCWFEKLWSVWVRSFNL